MATTRLTFLYPHLFRTGGRWGEPAASQAVRSSRPNSRHKPSSPLPPSPVSCLHAAQFTTPSAGRQAAFAKRAGKGIEPLPLNDASKTQRRSEGGKQEGREEKEAAKGATQATQAAQATQSTPSPQPSTSGEGSPQASSHPPPGDIDPITQAKKGSPMDELLHIGPPPGSSSPPPPTALSSDQSPPLSSTTSPGTAAEAGGTGILPNEKAPPHLTPPPYVHHFDSYTLVKQLTAGGYTLPQAILAMKAIRTLLASHLDVAQAGLVSKADMENESYLFRAACSELSAEVRNNRRVADEQLRQQRTLLQHEVDILAQRLNQELLTLNDSVRGMFNDRRMAVREEQKAVESRIQQINYKISVTLNSDAKSDIEALRWVLIRRSVLGIIFMAVLTLGMLRYATFVSHQRQKEAEQRAREAQEAKKPDGRSDHSPAPDAAEILAAN
ncbi:2a34c401-4395-4853-8e1a-4bd030fef276 [Thermothielavioides terrestris]|uniref:DUF1640 domain-containing protein n=2 Tax=Thermothielavioides terrestris TaxID=2587410 RepID=G2RBG9_THETT|nr:uncharacterized protein THITE_2119210 [Thermothielavioides terrestris NRRL 8126]AEO69140.1 hypothetical protein THITE_2119210 [Thermothielavioides terrestris NRRL 8126]SPQ22578.1 2a34c401-4395-4853-8e1a-4bd030fef276 [Thermothielavioides terrestris]